MHPKYIDNNNIDSIIPPSLCCDVGLILTGWCIETQIWLGERPQRGRGKGGVAWKTLKYPFSEEKKVQILVVLVEEQISTVEIKPLAPTTDLSRIRFCMED